MARIASLFAAFLLVIAGTFALATGTASAATCTPKWDVVVGGLGNNDSTGFVGEDQRVGYNSYDTQSGVNELNRLVREHRAQCPGDHISITGHSGGAAVVHVWVSQNKTFGNVNAVLLADPKRAAGPGGSGFADEFPFNLIRPLAGTDANFGSVPVLTICNGNDHICNRASDWVGYFTGAHGAYDFDVNHYATNASGVVYR
jgi:cutinase